jgi:hypothetical protein
MRVLVLILGAAIAWLLFALGLLSPLTPSEGYPRLIDIVMFVGVPVLLLGFVAYRLRRSLALGFVLLQLLSVVGISTWLLVFVLR